MSQVPRQFQGWAFEAVARLRQAGFSARRLRDGWPEWRRAGLPTGLFIFP